MTVMIKDGKCVGCEKLTKVLVTYETETIVLGLCEICYSDIEDVEASRLTNAMGIGNA